MKLFKDLLPCIFVLFLVTSSATATKTPILQDSEAATGATFWDALVYLHAGSLVTDTLELTSSGGVYGLKDTLILTVPIVIVAQDGLAEKPVLQPTVDLPYRSEAIIDLQEDLTLNGIVFDGHYLGTTELDSIRRVFRVNGTEAGPNIEPDFKLYNCDFRNVYQDGAESTEGKLIEFAKGASAGVVDVQNCTFTNFGDEVFNAGNANKNVGDYVVTPAHGGSFSEFTCKNCTFNNVDGSCIKLMADIDSTTVDGLVTLQNITFYNCARCVVWTRDLLDETVKDLLIVNSNMGHEDFADAQSLIIAEMFGTTISYVDTFNIEKIVGTDTTVLGSNPFWARGGSKSGAKRTATLETATIFSADPMFVDAANGDFTIGAGSACLTMASDGGIIGDRSWSGTSAVDDEVAVAKDFMLAQNYPNPFNPTTTIQFSLKQDGFTTLMVYDILGREVARLVNSDMKAGYHQAVFSDMSGMASGVYIYKLTSGDFSSVKKMMLMK